MSLSVKSRLLFIFLIVAYLAYAAAYIYQTSFVDKGERYFVLFDDAMISMRYARNLAQGNGLVWNPGGERVEGYTNPLWVVFMALFHLIPIPASKMSLFIQVSGALFLAANLVFVYKIGERLSGSALVAILSAVLTAFYGPLNNWGLQGMEVSALTLITSAVLWISLQNLKSQRFSAWLYALLGLGILIRLDMAVIYLVILAFFMFSDQHNRRKHLVWGVCLFLFFILSQTLFRFFYYGELLPNTYYLKMGGYPLWLRIARGFYVFLQFVWYSNWLLFILPFSLLLFQRDRSVWLLFLIFIGQVAYSIYVGGDAWEHRGGSNRYLSIVMPVFFILFVYTISKFVDLIVKINPLETLMYQLLYPVLCVGFVLASWLNFNLLEGDIKSLQRLALLRQPLFIEGNKEYVAIALGITEITTPQASIAVVAAGAIPYFSDRYAIDLLGKSDARIARLDVVGARGLGSIKNFRPGHMKWDYDYSIGELKPDVVVQLWGDTSVAQAYIQQYYTIGGTGDGLTFSLRTDSKEILWDKVQLHP